jgi:predicted RNase H-like nuclease (RuvC/YqgF family)
MAKMETNYTEKLREALKVRPRELEPGELAKVETKNGKLLERIVYLESHYQKLDAEYRKASAELARLQAALATAQRDKSQLQQLVDGKKLQELAAEIAILRRRDEQRAKRVRQLEADIRKLEKLLLANP